MGWDWYQYLNPLDPLIKDATKVKAPPPRDYGAEVSNILKASRPLYDNAAEYDPLYTDLATANAGRATKSLLGTYGEATGNISDLNSDLLAKFGPQYTQTLRAINPGQANLYDMLTKSATEGLAAGSRLTPGQTFTAAEPVRASWAARGFSADAMPGQLDEAVALARTGDNVLGQRQQTAASVADLGNQFYTQPATGLALSGGGADASTILGLGSGVSSEPPNNWEQLSAYGSDVFNTNYNADAAARIATANNRTGMISSMMSY